MAEYRKLAEQFDMTTGRGRLQAASAFLLRIYDEGRAFDIATWRSDDAECGTAACAVGWMAMDGEFQAQGLRLEPLDCQRQYWLPQPMPQSFFGISEEDSSQLFLGWFYADCNFKPTALDVADRIDALLARDAA